jgi:AraC family transcriptional regulator, arabinose operon regulatory protein
MGIYRTNRDLYKIKLVRETGMHEDRKQLLKSYLSNLQVNLVVAAHTHCWRDWRELDYTPEFNKFYLICSGEGWLKIGDREYLPKPGQLVLMPAGIIQSFSTVNENTFTKYWCHFTATIGDKNLFDILRPPFFIDVKDFAGLENRFEDLICSYRSVEITASLRVKSILLEMIAYYLDSAVVEEVHMHPGAAIEKMNHVLDYIDSHVGENIKVEQLSRMLHFHPNYFIKFFREHVGSSPIHYINKIRLEKAKGLIHGTELTMTEIAEKTGFGSLFHFSRSFKNHTGFSPSEFRNIRKYSR